MSTTATLTAVKSRLSERTGSSTSAITAISSGTATYTINKAGYNHACDVAFGFNQTLSNSVKYKKIEGAALIFSGYYAFHMDNVSDDYEKTYSLRAYALATDFSTATANATYRYNLSKIGELQYLTDIKKTRTDVTLNVGAYYVPYLYNYGVTLLADNGPSSTYGNPYLNLYVDSENASSKPRLRLTLSDTDRSFSIKTFTPAAGTSYGVYNEIPFSCTLTKDSGLSLEDIALSSGKIRYRAQGTTSETAIPLTISASTLTYTHKLPAWTLSAGSYEYAFQFNLNSGAVITTGWVPLTVTADDRTMVISSTSPANNSKNTPNRALNVSCTLSVNNKGCTTKLQPTSGELRYRTQNASTYTTISLATEDDVLSYSHTFPAGTFASGKYEYKFVFTNNRGDNITQDWVLFEVGDTTPGAPTIIYPSGDITDGSKPLTFKWRHNNASGLPASKADIAYKAASASAWTYALGVTGDTYTLPASSLTSGRHVWMVRTYNTDNQNGPFSAQITFTVVAAPLAPSVSIANPAPMASISWASAEQAAYQVEVDGVIVETGFGPKTTWSAREHLTSDVLHTFRVRVQNTYSLWSAWGTAELSPHNHGSLIPFYADKAGTGVLLSWNPSRECHYFRLYRDGVCIAQMDPTARSYFDDTAGGVVTYEIRGCFNSGFYDVCVPVSIDATPEHNRIKRAKEGSWLELVYSEVQNRVEAINLRRNMQLVHLAGNQYKTAERGEQYDETMQIACAFPAEDHSSMRMLEGLTGELVILNTNSGRSITGVIQSMYINETEQFTTYEFTVNRVEYSEDILHD